MCRRDRYNTKLIVNKGEVANAVTWLKYAGILSTCNLAVDGDMRNISESRNCLLYTSCTSVIPGRDRIEL